MAGSTKGRETDRFTYQGTKVQWIGTRIFSEGTN